MSTFDELHKLLQSSTEDLVECARAVRDLPFEPVGSNLRKIGNALAEISELRTEIYKSKPQLKPENWGKSLEENDYREMYEDAVRCTEEHLRDGKPEEGIEILEQFVYITPYQNLREMAEKKVRALKNEFAL